MAQKRMFDKSIIETDSFMDLPVTSKALYFLLGMEADDEGFVSPKRVLRIYGGSDDDVKVLTAKGFLIVFESGVVVITDWKKNNWLDSRRIKETEYVKEKGQLIESESGKYELLSVGLATARLEEKSIEENRIVEKSNKSVFGEFKNVKLTLEEYEKLVLAFSEKNTLILIEELSGYIASKRKNYASHYATLLNWGRRKIQDYKNKSETKKRYIA